MALKSKTKFNMLIDPDDPYTLILSPVEGELEPGSVYTVNINNLKLEDNTIYSNKETFLVAPKDNFLISVEDVKEMVHGLNIPDESIIRHIVDASKQAVYWAKKNAEGTNSVPDFNNVNLQEDYYPFYMFIKYHAMVEALKEFYIELISGPEKWRDMLSDLERQEEFDFGAIKAMIDDFENEADYWLELVVTITADPKWALRGKYCYSSFYTNSNPYHRIQWGYPPHNGSYNRGY
jgi:hypothetical protein